MYDHATMTTTTEIPNDLIGPAELAPLIHLTEASVRSDVSRRPWRLPPRVGLPGSNRLKWSLKAVKEWIAKELRTR